MGLKGFFFNQTNIFLSCRREKIFYKILLTFVLQHLIYYISFIRHINFSKIKGQAQRTKGIFFIRHIFENILVIVNCQRVAYEMVYISTA